MALDHDSVACGTAAGFEAAMRLMKIAAVQDASPFARASAFGNEERVFFFFQRGPNLLNIGLSVFDQVYFVISEPASNRCRAP